MKIIFCILCIISSPALLLAYSLIIILKVALASAKRQVHLGHHLPGVLPE